MGIGTRRLHQGGFFPNFSKEHFGRPTGRPLLRIDGGEWAGRELWCLVGANGGGMEGGSMGTSDPSVGGIPQKPTGNENPWGTPDELGREGKESESSGDHQSRCAGECRDLPGNPQWADPSGFCGHLESDDETCLVSANEKCGISARFGLSTDGVLPR